MKRFHLTSRFWLFSLLFVFALLNSSCSVFTHSMDGEIKGAAWIKEGTTLYRYGPTSWDEYGEPIDKLTVSDKGRMRVWIYEDSEGTPFVQVYGKKGEAFWNKIEDGNRYGEELPTLAWSPYSKTSVKDQANLYVARSNSFTYTYSKFDLTASVLPFKYRRRVELVPRQISTKFGVQLSPSMTFGINTSSMHFYEKANKVKSFDYRISVSPFIGLSTANLNPLSSDGTVLTAEIRDMWTLGYGLMIFGGFQRVNIGFGLGWDVGLLDKDRASWIYQGKHWYGIAIGYNLFGKER